MKKANIKVKTKGFPATSTSKPKPVAKRTAPKTKGKPPGNGVEVIPDDSDAGLEARPITGGLTAIGADEHGATPEELKAKSYQLSTQVSQFVVQSNEDLAVGADMLIDIKNAKAKAELWLGPQKKATWDAYQVALLQYKDAMEPLNAATKLIKIKMSDYQLEQEKAAEAARAEAGELDGEDLFDAITADAVSGMTKVKGISSTKDIEIHITNITELLKAVIDQKVLMDITKLVTVKPSIVKAFVKATGIREIPGVKVKDVVTQAVTGKK